MKKYLKSLTSKSSTPPPPRNVMILRIILSPLVFLWGCILIAVSLVFPLGVFIVWSALGLLLEPIIWLFRKSGAEIEGIETCLYLCENRALDHFLCSTIFIWGPFAMVYIYITEGEIMTF